MKKKLALLCAGMSVGSFAYADHIELNCSHIDHGQATQLFVGQDSFDANGKLSDGTLRALSLITLLLQPVQDLPDLIIVDEPELGLHPVAKNIVAGLLKKASHHCQVIVATQSSALVDAFDPDDVIVVDRVDRQSTFRRLDAISLQEWLKEYTLGQLWEKNVFGGGPF